MGGGEVDEWGVSGGGVGVGVGVRGGVDIVELLSVLLVGGCGGGGGIGGVGAGQRGGGDCGGQLQALEMGLVALLLFPFAGWNCEIRLGDF